MTNLQKIRLDKGLTQKQLAEQAQVHLRMVQNYEERTRNINGAAVMTVYRMAQVLECEITDIIEFE